MTYHNIKMLALPDWSIYYICRLCIVLFINIVIMPLHNDIIMSFIPERLKKIHNNKNQLSLYSPGSSFIWTDSVVCVTYWRSEMCCWRTHWGTSWRMEGRPQERSPQKNLQVLASPSHPLDRSSRQSFPKAPHHIVWKAHCHHSEQRCICEDNICQCQI